MVANYFKKSQNSSQEYVFNNIKINIGIENEKTTLFKNKQYQISIIIIRENEIINEIKSICEFIIKTFSEKYFLNKKIFINANWYIFYNTINIDLFKNIYKKENICFKNMHNRFSLINNINGEILFNPEKNENNVISDRMKFLYNYFNTEYPMDKEKDDNFSKEIMSVYKLLNRILYKLK